MDQQLGELAAFAEDLGLIPSTYLATHNCHSSSIGYGALFWPSQELHACGIQHANRRN